VGGITQRLQRDARLSVRRRVRAMDHHLEAHPSVSG
jgi:hypothetical protein